MEAYDSKKTLACCLHAILQQLVHHAYGLKVSTGGDAAFLFKPCFVMLLSTIQHLIIESAQHILPEPAQQAGSV